MCRWQTVTVLHHAHVYAAAALSALATRTRPARAARRPRPRAPIGDDYGLLRTIALVGSLDTGQSVRALLDAGGIRSTLATGPDGLVRVLVFPEAYERARRMVSRVL
jgi:hypothetical protein